MRTDDTLLERCGPVHAVRPRRSGPPTAHQELGPAESGAPARHRRIDHAQCVVLTAQFRGKLCDQLAHHPARSVAAGEFLYLAGEEARSVFLVRSGLVKTEMVSSSGQELTLSVYGPGDVLGELCLCTGERREQARALEASTVVELPLDLLIRRLREDPQAALDFISTVCRHLADAYARLHSLSVDQVTERVVRTLLRLAHDLGQTAAGGTRIGHRITQEELARLIGARREVVSGVLNRLRDGGFISYKRGSLMVVNREALHALLCSIEGEGSNVSRITDLRT